MKKRVLSLFLSLALCVTVMPQTVYAEEGRTPTVSGNEGGVSQTGQNGQLAAVQSLIDALPTLEELQTADAQKQQEIYEALQEAYDAYEALSAEEQALLTGADCFETLFGWFNAQVSLLEGETTHSHCICGSTHQAIGDHTTESVKTWTAINDTDGSGTIGKAEFEAQISGGGYFYLTADVKQTDSDEGLSVTADGVTVICLNGYEMKLDSMCTDGICISNSGKKLILTDCASTGKITFTQSPSVYGSPSKCGVSVGNGASFEMYGGTIKGMKKTYGAGVNCYGWQSSFKMYGGTITENTGNSDYDTGVAVHCGDNTSFTMYGGSITGNATKTKGSGGGVYCKDGSTFTMLGGEISGNTAALNGGGVIVDGDMTIGGTAKITGNTAGGKTGNLFLNGSTSVLNVRADFTGEVGLAALDGIGRQIVKREESSKGTITYDADGYTLDANGTLVLNHVHAPGEETADRCATCNCLLVASVTPQTGAASYHANLQDAMAAVTSGATVKLLRSADYAGDLKITQPMTLDLNGKWFYTVEGDVFILAEDVKILGNASGNVKGCLVRKASNGYDISYAAVTIGSTGENGVGGGLTLSNQTFVGVVTVLNGTFAMTDGEIYGLVAYRKGDTQLSGGTISEKGSGIEIKGEDYTIGDLLAEGRVLLAVTSSTSTPVTEEQLSGKTLTTSNSSISYKIAKPGFESVSITGGDTEVVCERGKWVKLTAVPVMTDGYDINDVTYQWYVDGSALQGANRNIYEFVTVEKSPKTPAEGGTKPAPYVIACKMTCGQYEQTAETKITVLPKNITAGEENVKLGNGSETFTYTGSALTPTVTLKDGDAIISPDEYELTYSDNLNAGTATVTFTDKPGGKYTVTGSVSFIIEKAENTAVIDGNATASVTSYGYGGTLPTPQLTPEPAGGTVTYYYNKSDSTTGGTPWSELTSTTLSAGDTPYYVYAEITWENYKTFTTQTTSFKVDKAKVPVTVWPTVKDVYVGDTLDTEYLEGGDSPVQGSFTVSGTSTSWNAAGSYETELTYTATSADKDNYLVNTKKATVNVIKRTLKSAQTPEAITDKYYGTAQTELGLPAKVSVTTVDGQTHADIPVTWSGYDPNSLKKQTLTGTLDISSIESKVQQPEPPVTASIEVALDIDESEDFPDKTVTYTGNPIAYDVETLPVGVASVTYEYEGKDGTEYAKTHDAPTNAGEYNIIVRFTMEEGQTQLSPIAATLTIAKAAPPAEAQMGNYDYGSEPALPKVTNNPGNAAVTYYYSKTNSNTGGDEWKDITATTLDVGTYYLYAVIAESDNYHAYTTAPVSFTVGLGNPPVIWPTVKKVYVGDTLDESYLEDGSSTVDGNFTITGSQKSWSASGTETIELTFTPTDTANYKTVTKEAEVSVVKRQVTCVIGSLKPIADKDFGTAFEDLGLPEKVDIRTEDFEDYKDIPVTWTGYNAQMLGSQFLVGTLDISRYAAELEQPSAEGTQPVTARIQVDLKRLIAPTPDYPDKEVTYNGQAQKHELASDEIPVGAKSISYSYEGTGSTKPKYPQVMNAPIDAGTYIVRANITMQYGYDYMATVSSTLTIQKADLSAVAQMGSYDYGSEPALPKVTDNPGNAAVTYYYSKTNSNTGGDEWKDITATTLDVGTYYLYAVIAESDNYHAYTTAPVSFTVGLGNPPVTWPTVKKVYVGDALDESYLEDGSSTVDGNFTITGSQKSWSASGTEAIELTFTPTDTANYKPVTKEAEVTVVKRQVAKVTSVLHEVKDKDFGTAFDDLELPAQVSIETEDGRTYSDIPVTWSGYNARTLNSQTLTGTLDISQYAAELEQPETAITAELQVTLQPLTALQPQQSVFPDQTVTYDGAAKSLALADADIPAGVEAVYYSYEGTDGTSYAKTETAPTNAGSYTVTASFTMENGYAPLDAITAKLTIARKNIAGADITLGAALTANGEQQTQTLAEVKLGDLTLTAEDYELSGNTASEAGEYTLIILGKGNYSGEVTKSWTLAEAEESGGSEGSSTGSSTGESEGSSTGESEGSSTGESEGSSTGESEGSSTGSTVTPTAYSWSNVDASQQNGNTVGGAVQGSVNINVRIPGGNIVPTYVLRTLCGTRLTLALQQGNGVSLSISGDALNKRNLSGVRMLDLTTDTNTGAIPAAAIQGRRTAGSRQLSIRDTGRFAIPVGLHVSMGAENAGRYANFYRYNEAQGRLEYCGSFRITESGQAMLALKQGGSYFINVTDTMPVEKYLFSADAYTVRRGDTLSRIARR